MTEKRQNFDDRYVPKDTCQSRMASALKWIIGTLVGLSLAFGTYLLAGDEKHVTHFRKNAEQDQMLTAHTEQLKSLKETSDITLKTLSSIDASLDDVKDALHVVRQDVAVIKNGGSR